MPTVVERAGTASCGRVDGARTAQWVIGLDCAGCRRPNRGRPGRPLSRHFGVRREFSPYPGIRAAARWWSHNSTKERIDETFDIVD